MVPHRYVMKLFVFGFLCENVQDICRLMKSSLVKMSENIDNIQNVATYILVCIYKVSSGKKSFSAKICHFVLWFSKWSTPKRSDENLGKSFNLAKNMMPCLAYFSADQVNCFSGSTWIKSKLKKSCNIFFLFRIRISSHDSWPSHRASSTFSNVIDER